MFISPACDSLKSDENRKQLSAANVLGSRLFVCLLILLLVLSLSSLGDTLDLSLLIQRLYIYLRTTLCLTCLINLSIFLERDIQQKYIDFLLKGNTPTLRVNLREDFEKLVNMETDLALFEEMARGLRKNRNKRQKFA